MKYLVACPSCEVRTVVELAAVPALETCEECGGWVDVTAGDSYLGVCETSIIDPFTGSCFVTVRLDG